MGRRIQLQGGVVGGRCIGRSGKMIGNCRKVSTCLSVSGISFVCVHHNESRLLRCPSLCFGIHGRTSGLGSCVSLCPGQQTNSNTKGHHTDNTAPTGTTIDCIVGGRRRMSGGVAHEWIEPLSTSFFRLPLAGALVLYGLASRRTLSKFRPARRGRGFSRVLSCVGQR